jgi:hypothetical protein
MTKKELVKLLEGWPDDTVVEIATLNDTDYTWYEISNVEESTNVILITLNSLNQR